MTWVLLLTTAWLAVSLPIALLVARSIRRADQEAVPANERRPLSVVHASDDVGTPLPRPAAPHRLPRRDGSSPGGRTVASHPAARRRTPRG